MDTWARNEVLKGVLGAAQYARLTHAAWGRSFTYMHVHTQTCAVLQLLLCRTPQGRTSGRYAPSMTTQSPNLSLPQAQQAIATPATVPWYSPNHLDQTTRALTSSLVNEHTLGAASSITHGMVLEQKPTQKVLSQMTSN